MAQGIVQWIFRKDAYISSKASALHASHRRSKILQKLLYFFYFYNTVVDTGRYCKSRNQSKRFANSNDIPYA